MDNIKHISAEEVRRLHQDMLEASGGLPGEFPNNSLEYITEMAPYVPARRGNGAGLGDIGSFLLARLAKSHPFVDCNKRTAYFATRYFLMKNGADFNGTDIETATSEMEMIAAAADMDSAELLARHMVKDDLVTGLCVVPVYESYYRMVVKSIGVAKRLSDR